MPQRALQIALLSLVLGAPIAACGGSSQGPRVTTLTPEEARVFEHGVDFIAQLQGLEGRWREDWNRELDERVGGADLVALVTVRTLRTDTDPEQRVTHRLFAQVDRMIFGEPHGRELQLAVREGEPGFETVNDNLSKIQNRSFVAYVKWYRNDDGELAAHWHLSPGSEQVVTETEGVVARRDQSPSDQPRERVIVHTN